MMVLRYPLLAACTLLVYMHAATAQQDTVPECPSPWVSEGNKCYLFSKEYQLPWEDAEIYCVKRGAELISVNSDIENSFVQNWFSLNDDVPGFRNQWYTSGRTVPGTPRNNPTFIWADKTGFGSKVQWNNPEAPTTDTGDFVVYKYFSIGGREAQPGYFWVRDNGLTPRAFICEINKVDAEEITSKSRDFVFGADNVHPDMLYRGPYFVHQPQDVQFYVDSDSTEVSIDKHSISFDCEARGYPQPEYTWYEDSGNTTKIISSIGASVNHMTISNGRLTIHNPSKDRDISAYWCDAYNQFGKIRSEKGRINFLTLDDFPRQPKTVNARAYESAVIVCEHAKREGVSYTYSWFLNDDPTNWVNPVYNNHIFLSMSGSLYFSSVTVSDNGAYHCLVGISGEVIDRTSPAYNLVVDGSPSYRPVGPNIHNDFIKIIPKNPKRGDIVYLECFARFTRRSGETAIYTWTRTDGKPLPKSSVLASYNRRLIINYVKPEDEGDYRCTVSAQQASDSKIITLGIAAKPYFGEGGLDSQHLDLGDDFRWICKANGKPEPNYRWYRNSTLFSPTTLPSGMAGRVTFSADMRTVEFTGLRKNVDPGMYQCAATNTLGTTYSTAQMRVLEFGPSFAKHPMLGKVLATEDGNATIPCDPEAAPKATITWLKDGNPLQLSKDTTSPKRLLPNNYVFLSGIERSVDEGVYTCVAENSVVDPDTGEPSRATADIQLLVVQRSRLAFGPIDTSVLLGNEVRLECRADFNPRLDLVYLWYHNDRLIDFDDWKMAQIYSRGEGVNRGDLHIDSVTYEERGQYKCTVMTKSDFATRSAMVIVYGPPGEPAGVRASNPSSHTVVISWSKGAENGAPITSYIIEKYNVDSQLWLHAKNVSAARDVATANTTVMGLFANTGYLFRIMAVNQYGAGKASVESMSVTTSPDRPTSYPENIQAGGGKEGTLVITWTPLPKEQWNAPRVEYMVEFKEFTDDPDQGSWQGCNDGQPIGQFDPKAGKCVVTLGRDKFFLPYLIRVWARNEIGDGPIPPAVRGMSAVRVPTQTTKQIVVQPYNASGLTVHWDPVPDLRDVTGGELLGFHIQYWKSGTPQYLGRRNTVLGNVTEGMLIGLESNTEYMVTAQLFNSAGDAPPGRSIPQTTWYNAPLNMPEYVTLNKTDDGSIGVHFRGVVTGIDEEPLDGYKVRIWRQGESIRTAQDYDCGRRTWTRIDDSFEKNSFYNLRVFGYSRGGVGKMSSPLIKFTLGCNRKQTPDDDDTQWVYLC